MQLDGDEEVEIPPIRFHSLRKRSKIIIFGIIIASYIAYSHAGVFLRQSDGTFISNDATEGITVHKTPNNTIDIQLLLANDTFNITALPSPTFCYLDSTCPGGILFQQTVEIKLNPAPMGTQVVIFLSLDFITWWVAGVSTAEDSITSQTSSEMTIAKVCAAGPEFHYMIACLLPPQLTNKYSKRTPPFREDNFNFCENIGTRCAGVCNHYINVNDTHCNLSDQTIKLDEILIHSDGRITLRTIYQSVIVNIVIYAFIKYMLMLMMQNAPLLKLHIIPKPVGNPSHCGEERDTVLAQITACGSESNELLIRNVLHSLFAMVQYLQDHPVHRMHYILNFDKLTLKSEENYKKFRIILNTIHLFGQTYQSKDKFSSLREFAEKLKIINFDYEVNDNFKEDLKRFGYYNYLMNVNKMPYAKNTDTSLQGYPIFVYEFELISDGEKRLDVTVFTPGMEEFSKLKNRKGYIEGLLDRFIPYITLKKFTRKVDSPGKFDALESTRKYLIKKYPKIKKKNIFLATIDARHAPQLKFWQVSLPFFYTQTEPMKSVRLENHRLHQQLQEYDADRTIDYIGMECGGFFYETNYVRSLVNCVTSSGSQSIVHLGDCLNKQEFRFQESIVEDLATSLKYITNEKFSYSSYSGAVYSTMKSAENFLVSVVRWSAGSVENFLRTIMSPLSQNFKAFVLVTIVIETYAIGLTVWTNYIEMQSWEFKLAFEFCIFFYLIMFIFLAQYRTFQSFIVIYLAITYPFSSTLTSFFWTIFMVGALSFGMEIRLNALTLILIAALSLVNTIAIQRIIYTSQRQGHVKCIRDLRKDQKLKQKEKLENAKRARKVIEDKGETTSLDDMIESGEVDVIGNGSQLIFYNRKKKTVEQDYRQHPIAGKLGHINFAAFAFRNWMTSSFTQPFVIIAGFICFFDRPVWNMDIFKVIVKYAITVQFLFYLVCVAYPVGLALFYYFSDGYALLDDPQVSVGWVGAVFAILYLLFIYAPLSRVWNFKEMVIGNACVGFIIAISSIALFAFFCASTFTFTILAHANQEIIFQGQNLQNFSP